MLKVSEQVFANSIFVIGFSDWFWADEPFLSKFEAQRQINRTSQNRPRYISNQFTIPKNIQISIQT